MLLSEARLRVLRLVKQAGRVTVSELAEALGTTDVAVRQHLAALEAAGLVDSIEPETHSPRGRGRPSGHWITTASADRYFPDSHAELTVGLIRAVRLSLGEDGLERVIGSRAREQIEQYRAIMPASGAPLEKRVRALAHIRTDEGYLASVERQSDGSLLLIESHCPICDAAKSCLGLCRAELDVFRRVLGDDVSIERIEHLLSEGRRCVYRISHMNDDAGRMISARRKKAG